MTGSKYVRPVLGAALLLAVSGPAIAQPPSETTKAANRAVMDALPFDTDKKDFDWASRGFIANREDPLIKSAGGKVVWDLSATKFLDADAPHTANPSLWRNSQLMAISGLFKAAEDVYQVRGFDLANVTFVKGETGWIVIDPLTAGETARAAFELLKEHAGDHPISAMVYTHSHGDHYGGSKALMEFAAQDMPVIAPAGFLEESISENIIAGPAMRRRAMYHVGDPLALSPKERIGTGLGVGLATGTFGMVPPNKLISRTGEELTVDGVRMVFQITSGTEAPAEFNIGFPDLGVTNIAENANPTHHNILTPRGAKVRDAKLWAESLTESIDMFDYADVLVVSHGWPVFGKDEIAEYLSYQRDAYAFLHDQTVRLMNQGLTLEEIAAQLKLPDAVAKQWYNRPYYGDYRFNARAVYQGYLGWFDGNPVHLEPLTPETAGTKYVAAMGGAAKVLEQAKAAFDEGDYRWASELLNRLVFADAGHDAAKELLADTYEQMGWQTENALWRNFYLSASKELRGGVKVEAAAAAGQSLAIIGQIPTPDMFDVLATRLNPERAEKTHLGFVFPGRGEEVSVKVENGVLVHVPGISDEEYDAVLTANRADFLRGLTGAEPLAPKITSGEASVEGDPEAFKAFASWLDQPNPAFNIVTP